MATTTIIDFLDAKKTQLAAILDTTAGTPKLFNRVVIVPAIDVSDTATIARWPQAAIVDGGGVLSDINGKVYDRVMIIAIMGSFPRDSWGEKAAREILRIGGLMVDTLEYDRSDSAIVLRGDDDAIAEKLESGMIFVVKTYNFSYKIERA